MGTNKSTNIDNDFFKKIDLYIAKNLDLTRCEARIFFRLQGFLITKGARTVSV